MNYSRDKIFISHNICEPFKQKSTFLYDLLKCKYFRTNTTCSIFVNKISSREFSTILRKL